MCYDDFGRHQCHEFWTTAGEKFFLRGFCARERGAGENEAGDFFREAMHNRLMPLARVNMGLWHIESIEEEVKRSLSLLIFLWSLSHEQKGPG